MHQQVWLVVAINRATLAFTSRVYKKLQLNILFDVVYPVKNKARVRFHQDKTSTSITRLLQGQ